MEGGGEVERGGGGAWGGRWYTLASDQCNMLL